jgi:hypothetical protein
MLHDGSLGHVWAFARTSDGHILAFQLQQPADRLGAPATGSSQLRPVRQSLRQPLLEVVTPFL